MTEQFKRLSMDELCLRLCQPRKTLIIYHVRSDADAIGSAFALRELLRMMDIPAICACADEVPDRLRFITDGTQGSVLLEEGMELDHDRVISVDSASPAQLGSLYDRLHKYIDIMIDHHAMGSVYADNYVDSDASATGEIIFEVAKRLVEMGKIPEIPHRVINSVYAAICSDTGCFRFANATPKTFRTAAELIEAGAEQTDINRKLFEAKTFKQVKAEGEAARRMQLFDGGRIASVTFPYSSKFSMSLSDENLETIIDIPRSVSGVEVAFSVRQPEDAPLFRVSMRSSSDFDVSEVCALFGGGGHMRAAGCTVKAANVREAEEMVLNAVREQMKK
ncbi:MAG: bifunctional oligoribonuclease/PAP phosphatase NrnA [Clostridia bacterium]|nr:bifunctional oligoribonuclease/PAP phosphatase NrnA [Clostridia bacterium]